jgi:hypothetical protein
VKGGQKFFLSLPLGDYRKTAAQSLKSSAVVCTKREIVIHCGPATLPKSRWRPNYSKGGLKFYIVWLTSGGVTLISLCFLLCSQRIAPATTRPKPAKPPTTPPAIAPAWLVGGDEVELAVEEVVFDVDIEYVLLLITLSDMELLAGALMTIELDSKMLVNETVVSVSRERA